MGCGWGGGRVGYVWNGDDGVGIYLPVGFLDLSGYIEQFRHVLGLRTRLKRVGFRAGVSVIIASSRRRCGVCCILMLPTP